MKCYAAKAIYHVQAAISLLALDPANPIIKYTEHQYENSTNVNAPPESPGPRWQTVITECSWLLHETQAAFITAICADAALSPLVGELKKRYGSGGLGLNTG